MADLDEFTRELGIRQGRIAPSGTTAPAGSKVVCLGHDLPGHMADLAPGDFVQVEQEAAFAAGTKLFRLTADIRPPAVIPTGFKWVFRVLVDDVVCYEHRLIAGGILRRRTFAVNVSKFAPGNHTVTLRLQFLTDDNTQYIVAASSECGP